jgi:hypothetical protein
MTTGVVNQTPAHGEHPAEGSGQSTEAESQYQNIEPASARMHEKVMRGWEEAESQYQNIEPASARMHEKVMRGWEEDYPEQNQA